MTAPSHCGTAWAAAYMQGPLMVTANARHVYYPTGSGGTGGALASSRLRHTPCTHTRRSVMPSARFE